MRIRGNIPWLGRGGFTLLELVMVIVIIGILGTVAVRSADLALDRNRYYASVEEMKTLGYGIAGNPDLVSAGQRSDFGYVGDMGSLPTTLDQLVTSQGGTWDGPYVVNPIQEDADAFKTDGWGQAYTFPVSGSKIKISSAGGGEAVTYQFAASEASLTSNSITGTISDWNGASPTSSDLSNITVRVDYPSGGAMTSASVTPSAGGVFTVTGIPVGVRRLVASHSTLSDSVVRMVTVPPGSSPNVDLRFNATLPGTEGGGDGGAAGSLVYVPGSAATFGGSHDTVLFQVQNSGTDPVGITSLTAEYSHTPPAYYTSIIRDYLFTIWSGSSRYGSGDSATFGEEGVSAGATTTLALVTFRNTRTGNGSAQNMSGVALTITFSDGSEVTFTVP